MITRATIKALLESWDLDVCSYKAVDFTRPPKRSRAAGDGIPQISKDRLLIAEALARLPPKERRIIEVSYTMGLCNEDARRVLGLNKAAFYRARSNALEEIYCVLNGIPPAACWQRLAATIGEG